MDEGRRKKEWNKTQKKKRRGRRSSKGDYKKKKKKNQCRAVLKSDVSSQRSSYRCCAVSRRYATTLGIKGELWRKASLSCLPTQSKEYILIKIDTNQLNTKYHRVRLPTELPKASPWPLPNQWVNPLLMPQCSHQHTTVPRQGCTYIARLSLVAVASRRRPKLIFVSRPVRTRTKGPGLRFN